MTHPKKPALEGVLEDENVHQNGFLVNISQADLPRNEGQAPVNLGNKKPRQTAGPILIRATGAPPNAPVAKPNTPATEVLSHEFYS